MKILSLDTSTIACSVSLMIDESIISQFVVKPREHAQLILPMVDSLLSEAAISLSQLDVLAFTAGPGAFTGIRIGAGVIQGLAYGADLPVIPVSSLGVLAQGAYRQLQATQILAALDARMKQVYWGVYRIVNGIVEAQAADIVSDPGSVPIPHDKNWLAVGPGWHEYATELNNRLTGHIEQTVYCDHYPHAQDIFPLAVKLFEEGKGVSPENALPVYVRDQVVR